MIRSLSDIGEGEFTTLTHLASQKSFRDRARGQGILGKADALLDALASGLAPLAGNVENRVKLPFAQNMYSGIYRDFGDDLLKKFKGDADLVDLQIKRMVKREINKVFPTKKNAGAGIRFLNEISPFLSYTFRNHVVWISEFLSHPVWFNRIAAGQRFLTSQNEEIWERSEELDITRKPDPGHLAFGFAEHFCLGASLARHEIRLVLGELLKRYPNYELVAEPQRVRAHMTPGIKTMPVVFHR
jgi:hypothetical protein